ncbi:MAG: hypothetical protein ABWX94_03270 [Candidatus Saccharimonadales bacterium]
MSHHETARITQFNPELHRSDVLRHRDLAIVATALPEHILYPGTHVTTAISDGIAVAHQLTGAIVAARTDRGVVARAMQRVAYHQGLEPGNAGIYCDGRDVEPLASVSAKEALLNHAATVGYVAFGSVVDAGAFGGQLERLDSDYTRHSIVADEVIGYRLADLNMLVGAQGLTGLRDPADHPIARNHLALMGLRGLAA